MIQVDIEVPSLGRTYNFRLEEQTPVRELLEEITGLICQRENCVLGGDAGDLCLAIRDSREILDPSACLSQYAAADGSILLLL